MALEQRPLSGDQFAGDLKSLGVTAVANRVEVQHLAAITQPTFPRGEGRAILVSDVHQELLRQPPVPSPAEESCHQSSPGSDW